MVLGVIGLAELLQPGFVDKLLALDVSGNPIQFTRQGSQLELSWPLIRWRFLQSENLTAWVDRPGLPNPYRINPDRTNVFYRITR